MKNKKAAMELAMSTIVIIVLSVTLLIGGIIFIQRILSVSKGVLDLTDTQLRSQINTLFSEEDRLMIYPQTGLVQIRQGTIDEVGIGIQNLETGASASTEFSYEVTATDTADCGISKAEVESWIVTGREGSNIQIAPGDITTDRVRFRIPVGSPLCIARFRVNVEAEGKAYKSATFDIQVKGKGLF